MAQLCEKSLGTCLVLGAGQSGIACAKYLAGLGPRVSSITLVGGNSSHMTDELCALESLGVELKLKTEEIEGTFDLAIASPGIPEHSSFYRSALEHARELIGEPELAWRESPKNWVAITGTNGKTTTTALTTHLLNASNIPAEAVGNIGVSITERLSSRSDTSWFVAELSSFQLASSRLLHPRVAVCLNITPDHLEWHGSFEAYASAKEKLFAQLGPDDLAIISIDDEPCKAIASRLHERKLNVCELSTTHIPTHDFCAYLDNGMLYVRKDGVITPVIAQSSLALSGDHNASNALAATTTALFLGANVSDVSQGLASFKPLVHRVEPLGVLNGVSYVNDSKATNTDSAEKALSSFAAKSIIALLGGHDKGTPLESLAECVCKQARVAICFGEAKERIAQAIRACDPAQELYLAEHMHDATTLARSIARPGETVLLSPACSSFDEFSNFEERGDAFKELVGSWIKEGEVSA